MAKIVPWTRADDQMLRDLHAQGLPLNQIAKSGKIQFSRTTIHKHSMALGLSYDRSAMVAPIEASRLDRKAKRQEQADQLSRTMTMVLENLASGLTGQGFDTVTMDMGKQVHEELAFIPPQDLKAVTASLMSLTNAVKIIESIDGNNGVDEGKSKMAAFMAMAVAMRDSQKPVE